MQLLILFLQFQFKALDREIKAHRAVSHPSVLQLVDVDVVQKGNYKEARMLVPYYKVHLTWLVFLIYIL